MLTLRSCLYFGYRLLDARHPPRIKCKRWIAHAVLARAEDTLNQYTRTKSELQHLKKHKVQLAVAVLSGGALFASCCILT